jgi:hypothetical protein
MPGAILILLSIDSQIDDPRSKPVALAEKVSGAEDTLPSDPCSPLRFGMACMEQWLDLNA